MGNKSRKLNEKLMFFFSFVLFKISIDWACITLFNDYYSGASGLAIQMNSQKYLISWLCAVIMFAIVASMMVKKDAVRVFFLFLFLLSYFGGNMLYGLVDLPNDFFIIFSLYWLVFSLLCQFAPTLKSKKLNVVGNSYAIFYTIFSLSLIISVYISYRFNGLQFMLSLDFATIDEVRKDSYEFLSGINAYMVFWIADVVIPLAITHFALKRKWLAFGAGIIVQVLLFSINGTKTWLLTIPIVFAIVLFYRKEILRYLGAILCVINIIGVIIYKLFDFSLLTNLLTRRMFIAQSINNYFYFDFFSNNPVDMLKSSILRWLGQESIYKKPIPIIISEQYYGISDSYASSGLFADAYSNFGFLGVLLYPLLLVTFFLVFEELSKGIERKEVLVIVIISSIFLLNGSFFTVLLTFGLLVSLLVMFFYPRYTNISD